MKRIFLLAFLIAPVASYSQQLGRLASDVVLARNFGTPGYAALSNALAAVGSAKKTILLDGGVWNLGNVTATVPATVTLDVATDSMIVGEVRGLRHALPEWWGAFPDDGVGDGPAINSAIRAAREVTLAAGEYTMDRQMLVRSDRRIVGQGSGNTVLKNPGVLTNWYKIWSANADNSWTESYLSTNLVSGNLGHHFCVIVNDPQAGDWLDVDLGGDTFPPVTNVYIGGMLVDVNFDVAYSNGYPYTLNGVNLVGCAFTLEDVGVVNYGCNKATGFNECFVVAGGVPGTSSGYASTVREYNGDPNIYLKKCFIGNIARRSEPLVQMFCMVGTPGRIFPASVISAKDAYYAAYNPSAVDYARWSIEYSSEWDGVTARVICDGCYISNIDWPSGATVQGYEAYFGGFTGANVVRNCIIDNNQPGLVSAYELDTTPVGPLVIENNVFRNIKNGVRLQATKWGGTVTDFTIKNNYFRGTHMGVVFDIGYEAGQWASDFVERGGVLPGTRNPLYMPRWKNGYISGNIFEAPNPFSGIPQAVVVSDQRTRQGFSESYLASNSVLDIQYFSNVVVCGNYHDVPMGTIEGTVWGSGRWGKTNSASPRIDGLRFENNYPLESARTDPYANRAIQGTAMNVGDRWGGDKYFTGYRDDPLPRPNLSKLPLASENLIPQGDLENFSYINERIVEYPGAALWETSLRWQNITASTNAYSGRQCYQVTVEMGSDNQYDAILRGLWFQVEPPAGTRYLTVGGYVNPQRTGQQIHLLVQASDYVWASGGVRQEKTYPTTPAGVGKWKYVWDAVDLEKYSASTSGVYKFFIGLFTPMNLDHQVLGYTNTQYVTVTNVSEDQTHVVDLVSTNVWGEAYARPVTVLTSGTGVQIGAAKLTNTLSNLFGYRDQDYVLIDNCFAYAAGEVNGTAPIDGLAWGGYDVEALAPSRLGELAADAAGKVYVAASRKLTGAGERYWEDPISRAYTWHNLIPSHDKDLIDYFGMHATSEFGIASNTVLKFAVYPLSGAGNTMGHACTWDIYASGRCSPTGGPNGVNGFTLTGELSINSGYTAVDGAYNRTVSFAPRNISGQSSNFLMSVVQSDFDKTEVWLAPVVDVTGTFPIPAQNYAYLRVVEKMKSRQTQSSFTTEQYDAASAVTPVLETNLLDTIAGLDDYGFGGCYSDQHRNVMGNKDWVDITVSDPGYGGSNYVSLALQDAPSPAATVGESRNANDAFYETFILGANRLPTMSNGTVYTVGGMFRCTNENAVLQIATVWDRWSSWASGNAFRTYYTNAASTNWVHRSIVFTNTYDWSTNMMMRWGFDGETAYDWYETSSALTPVITTNEAGELETNSFDTVTTTNLAWTGWATNAETYTLDLDNLYLVTGVWTGAAPPTTYEPWGLPYTTNAVTWTNIGIRFTPTSLEF